MVLIKLYTFAGLRERLGEDPVVSLELDKDVWQSGKELKEFLLQELWARWTVRQNQSMGGGDLELPPARTLMLAVNESFVDETASKIILHDNYEVALIPPVSGG